jgi:hypothetical protein
MPPSRRQTRRKNAEEQITAGLTANPSSAFKLSSLSRGNPGIMMQVGQASARARSTTFTPIKGPEMALGFTALRGDTPIYRVAAFQ